MKARFINEKFEEQSDPIQDMGIGDRLFTDKKLFTKEKTVYFLEVEEPNGKFYIYRNKAYESPQKIIRAYNSGYYSTYDRNTEKYKKKGYKFRIVTAKVKYEITNIKEV